MSDLRRLGRYLLKFRLSLIVAVVSAVLASFFLGGAIGLIPDLVGALSESAVSVEQSGDAGRIADDRAPRETAAGPLGEVVDSLNERITEAWVPVRAWLLERGFVRVPLAIVFLYLLKGIFAFASVYSFRRVGLRAVVDLRSELYAKSLAQSDEFFRRYSTAEMLSRILSDVARLQRILGADIGQALQSVPIVIVLLGYSFYSAFEFAGVCMIAVPIFVFTAGRFGRRVRKASHRSQERSAEITSLVEETLMARRVVHAFGAVGQETRRFDQALRRMLHQDLKVARATAATPPVMEVLGAFLAGSLIVYAGLLIAAGRVDRANVFAVILALFVVFTHVRKLATLYTSVQQALASACRVFEILDEPVKVDDRPGALKIAGIKDGFEIRRVSFSYGRGPVLDDVSLTVRAGEVHALVGPSGSGKSTLAMLLPRFHDPTRGEVLLDGIDLREISLESLRAHIGLVTQEVHLFDDTIAANIAYGCPSADIDAIREAARAAHAEEFIDILPQGFDTRLGERGGQLSMGQRQRIAIARAFLKDAPILILDEPTSALDAASERAVQEALEALLVGRTAIVIAHRLFTVTRADRIHVLEAGRIIESGSHEDLLAAGRTYARLHALQSFGS